MLLQPNLIRPSILITLAHWPLRYGDDRHAAQFNNLSFAVMSAFTGRFHVTYSILDMIIFVYKVCFSFLFCSNIACQCNSCTRFSSAERIFVNTKWNYVCRMEEDAFDRMATI